MTSERRKNRLRELGIEVEDAKPLTWQELADEILSWTHDQRHSHVTAFLDNEGEFYPVYTVAFSEEDDVLDKDHPYLKVKQ